MNPTFTGFKSNGQMKCINFNITYCVPEWGRRYGLVDVETDYGLDGRGSVPGRGRIFFSSPQIPNRLWDPSSLLFNGYRNLLPRG
jgi:hypothetical protein